MRAVARRISGHKHEVEIVRREDDGSWSRHSVSGQGVVHSAVLDVELPLAEIYRDPLRPT